MGKTAWQADQQQAANSAGHTVTDGRKKSKGPVIVVLPSAVWMNDSPKKYKETAFLQRRLEDCKAWIRAHDQIFDQHTRSALARLRGRSSCCVTDVPVALGCLSDEHRQAERGRLVFLLFI